MSFSEELNHYIYEWFDNIIYPTRPEGLYSPIVYTMSSGGKRLRPTLLLAGVKAFGGNPLSAKCPCLGIEIFHNFTLLHDDVMDNSDVRRGQPTVHRKWDNNTAILSGDTMLTMATELMCGVDDRHLRKVLQLFNKTAIEIYEGQQLDMDFEDRNDVSVDEYINMITLKTSVLLGCALKVGALLADAEPEAAEALYNYGINLGIGFQLRDDYLDTFGDPLIFGKQIGGDILNDKKTWLMITAVNEDKSGIMAKALDNSFDDREKIENVTSVYRRLGLDKRILSLINHYSEKAVECLAGIPITPQSRRFFTELAAKLTERTH